MNAVASALLRTSLLVSLTTGSLLAGVQSPHKPFGTVEKGAVDGTVALLRQRSADGTLGDGTVRSAAKALTALGHCHRFYGNDDGPVVRGAIRTVLGGKQADGSFRNADDAAPATTTRWAVEALGVMEPEYFAEEIRAAESWLATNDAGGASPWIAVCDAVLAMCADGSTDPKKLGAKRAAALASIDAGDADALVDGLLRLVACQAVARQMDAEHTKPAAMAAWSETQQQGVAFLMTQQEDGRFFITTPSGKFPDTGLTALGLAALQTKPAAKRSAEETAAIDAGLKFLLSEQNEDGSFAQRNANYTTCAAILALAKAKREAFRPALEKARDYILGIQNVESRGYARGDRDYGSIGYGGDQRGDLSNMQFAVEALRAAGVEADDEALAKAVVFLQRTQNLKSVNDFSGRVRNDGEWQEVTSGDDGGSAYYPGNSPAGYIELPDGKSIPRSYGSMTYALLKTYTLAGVKGDDPRVKAAVNWIEKNWTLDENPGVAPSMPEKDRFMGLYYYYMVLSQALDAAGIDRLEVPTGDDGATVESIDWRKLLRDQLANLQGDDGSWVNEKNGRWWEDKPAICTIYSLLALERCE